MTATFTDLRCARKYAKRTGRPKASTSPFPIRPATAWTRVAGRDVLGRGRTGSGKTIAFAFR